jgi:PTH2 family peptidyl-tRNA hydrolase
MKMAKQIIIVRKDLKMRRGKEIAQSCHASLATILNNKTNLTINPDGSGEMTLALTPAMVAWLTGRFVKITCVVNSLEELQELQQKALSAGLPCALIKDAGFTEFHGVETITCLGIGPAFPEDVDPITKELTLY